jgi:hypothetical protein
LESIIDKCRICGTEGETIEHIISSCTVLAQSEYKKRHDIFANIIHMNLVVKFILLKDTQPHYIYKPESCLENDNYKLYFDRTVLELVPNLVTRGMNLRTRPNVRAGVVRLRILPVLIKLLLLLIVSRS